MEPGEENDTGLQFRTQLPDLKLLPVNYDAPPTESDSFMSPRVAGVEAEMLKRTEILIEQDGSGKKKIKGGTIYSIVNYFLTDKDAAESDLRFFLRCYRKWCSPFQLWEVVTTKFFPEEKEMDAAQLQRQREAVIKFLLDWIDMCGAQDFFSSKEKFANPLWKDMHRFLKQLEPFPTFSKHLVQKVKEKSEQGNDGIFFGDADYRGVVWSITQTLFPRSLVPGQFKFIDLHPTEVVACLTMTEFNLFRNIRLREFLDKTWLTEQMSSLVYVMVNRFNFVAFWVATEICSTPVLATRRTVLERFITIADGCWQMNNFNSSMEILAGLSMGPVSRLKHTWGGISTAALDMFKRLENEMKPTKNYQLYREKMQKLKKENIPLLPWLGLILKDITFMDENPDHLDNGLINFEKVGLLGNLITEVEWFQSQTFSLQEVEEPIVNFLNNLNLKNEDELYKISLAHEPRGS